MSPRLAPPMIEKSLKVSEDLNVILILKRFRGGPVEVFFGGASLETFSGEGQLKKHPVCNPSQGEVQSHRFRIPSLFEKEVKY